MRFIIQFEEYIVREQMHYFALQRRQQQPCADDLHGFNSQKVWGKKVAATQQGPAVFARAQIFALDKRPLCAHAAFI